MDSLLPHEKLQRAAIDAVPTLRAFVEGRPPARGVGWPAWFAKKDRMAGRRPVEHSLDDPRFLLRAVQELGKRRGSPITSIERGWAGEALVALNTAAHEPGKLDERAAADAIRAIEKLTAAAATVIGPSDAANEAALVEATSGAGSARHVRVDLKMGDTEPATKDQPAFVGRDVRIAQFTPTPNVFVRVAFPRTFNAMSLEGGESPVLSVTIANTGAEPVRFDRLVLGVVARAGGSTTASRTVPLEIGELAGKHEIVHEISLADDPALARLAAGVDEPGSPETKIIVDCHMPSGRTTMTCPDIVIPRDAWVQQEDAATLAAFVRPNSPALTVLDERLRARLGAATGSAELDAHDPDRTNDIGRAALAELARSGLRLRAEEAVSWPPTIIREPFVVRSSGEATPLEFATLAASLLERADLAPILARALGETYVGWLPAGVKLADPVLTDRKRISAALDDLGLRLVSVTELVGSIAQAPSADAVSARFDHAFAAASDAKHGLPAAFETRGDEPAPLQQVFVLDVRQARAGVRPARELTEHEALAAVEQERKVQPPVAPIPMDTGSGADAAIELTPAMRRQFARWSSSLLDLSLRNPLLNIEAAKGRVELLVAESPIAHLEDVLESGRSAHVFARDEVADAAERLGVANAAELTAQQRDELVVESSIVFAKSPALSLGGKLDALRRRSEDTLAETGANNLFLSLGQLSWSDESGATAHAPVFLVPITIKGRTGRGFEIARDADGETIVNTCLLERLKKTFDATFDALEHPAVEDRGLDLPTIFAQLTAEIARIGAPLTFTAEASIAMLEFARVELWRDLRDSAGRLAQAPLVRALAGDREAAAALVREESDGDERGGADREIDDERYLAVPADGSQLRAVEWAARGRTFVLQGPPGTGKSQTITNMIADAVARGRRVLFVAEKAAALDIVRRNLVRAGLETLMLDLHDRTQKSRDIRVQLRTARQHGETAHDEAALRFLREKHAGDIARLATYPAALRGDDGSAAGSLWTARAAELEALRRGDEEAVARARAAVGLAFGAPAVAGFDRLAREHDVQEYIGTAAALHREVSTSSPAFAVRRDALAVDPAACADLTHDLEKRRPVPIRTLVERHRELFLALAPIVLASPGDVARHFPPATVAFDLVVFDEASQIRTADAIGAIGRARSAVIVGDAKQMPPSSTFETVDPTGDYAFEDEDAGLVPDVPRSILDAATAIGVPSIGLAWHYRSRDESLIAFSNDKYYDGRLKSFPMPPRDLDEDADTGLASNTGVTLRRVDGRFDGGKGGTRTNVAEADAIELEILRRLRADANASIGVVTFNYQQRELILDRLEQSPHPEVQAALARDDDKLFVKNLEVVQGDERDVILFSLGFSPDPETNRLRLNFGPLTRSGGEHRLNVAVTRARDEVVVFSSFDSEDIDLERTRSVGVQHLRDYLEFAETESYAAGVDPYGEWSGEPHVDDVAAALRAEGFEVRTGVGGSGFRVDLAVRAPGGDWVAVLLDTPEWAARPTVADRDAIPRLALTDISGWSRVEWLFLPDWLRDRAGSIARLAGAALALAGAQGAGPEQDGGANEQHGEEAAPIAPPLPQEEPETTDESSPYPATVVLVDFAPAPVDHVYATSDAGDPALILDAVRSATTVEGPVEAARLTRIVNRRFGQGGYSKKQQSIVESSIPRGWPTTIEDDGTTFYWPEGADPRRATTFRRFAQATPELTVQQLSLHEIGLAVVFVLAGGSADSAPGGASTELIHPSSKRIDVLGEVRRILGYKKLGVNIRNRIQAAIDELVARGAVAVDAGDGIGIAEDDVLLTLVPLAEGDAEPGTI